MVNEPLRFDCIYFFILFYLFIYLLFFGGWESSLSVCRSFTNLAIQNAPSKDSNQTARIFVGRVIPKVAAHFILLVVLGRKSACCPGRRFHHVTTRMSW